MTGDTPDTSPFFLPAGRTGCLLIHGFTGTPYEMRFLGERLHAHGHTVSGVQLAGHCTSVEDLEQCTWRDWYASARDGVERLQQHAARTIIVGQSMGALLALKLAVDYPAAVTSLALLSPALVLSNRWLQWIAPALPLLLRLLGNRYRYVGKGQSDIADEQARAQCPSYQRVPLRALYQLLTLQKQVRSLLPHVRQPVVIIHSRQDHTCPVRNVEIIRRGLGRPVRSLELGNSYHVISMDVDKERIATEVAAFVQETVAAEATPALR